VGRQGSAAHCRRFGEGVVTSSKPNIGKIGPRQEVSRLFKHYFIDNILFLWLLLKEFVLFKIIIDLIILRTGEDDKKMNSDAIVFEGKP